MAAGSISIEEFRALAQHLAEFSLDINDSWRVVQSPCSPDELYLEKNTVVPEQTRTMPQFHSQDHGSSLHDPDLECQYVQDDDPGYKEVPLPSCHLTYQFHVVYSHSYAVPVLYFNVFKPGGQRLQLEDLWSRVPAEYQERMQEHKWATLTQQEHPLLGCPYFMLHPCQTASLMSQVPQAQDKRYYLIKWLSSVGPVVGLEMMPAYATAFDRRETT